MATGKPAQIVEALFEHAALMATTGPQRPVSFPEPPADRPFVVPDDGKYLEVSFASNVPAWQSVSGAGSKIDQGLLQVMVVWPKHLGTINPLQDVALVEAHFRGATLFNGSTKVKIYAEPYHAAALEEPDAVKIPVIISWRA